MRLWTTLKMELYKNSFIIHYKINHPRRPTTAQESRPDIINQLETIKHACLHKCVINQLWALDQLGKQPIYE